MDWEIDGADGALGPGRSATASGRIDPDWVRDVLDLLLAQVLELVGQLVSDLVPDHS